MQRSRSRLRTRALFGAERREAKAREGVVAGLQPSPGADVGRVSPVPVQMWWQGASPVPAQMWGGVSAVRTGSESRISRPPVRPALGRAVHLACVRAARGSREGTESGVGVACIKELLQQPARYGGMPCRMMCTTRTSCAGLQRRGLQTARVANGCNGAGCQRRGLQTAPGAAARCGASRTTAWRRKARAAPPPTCRAILHAESPTAAGKPCRVGYRAAWDIMPRGIPCPCT